MHQWAAETMVVVVVVLEGVGVVEMIWEAQGALGEVEEVTLVEA